MGLPMQEAPSPAVTPSTAESEGLVSGLLTRWLFREAQVARNERILPGLHRIELSGTGLQGVQWHPGDKLQLRMGSGLQTRTYTPLYWDAEQGRTAIVAHALAMGPGSEWIRRASPGQPAAVFGPRRSLNLSALPAAKSVLVGDETAIGLAAAWQPAGTILEVDGVGALQPLLGSLGIDATLVPRQAAEHHHPLLTQAAIAAGGAADCHFVLVGRARTVQFMLRALRQEGVPARSISTKAYWADGKAGLD